MSNAADFIDRSPMAQLVTQLVGTSPMDIANLGKALMGAESSPAAGPSNSGGSIMGSIKEMLVGADVPAERPLQPAMQIAPAQHVNDGELFNFVAQQFDGVRQQASRGTGFGGIA